MTRLTLLLCVVALVTVIVFVHVSEAGNGSSKKQFVVQRGVYEEQQDLKKTRLGSDRNHNHQHEQCCEISKLEALVNFFEETRDWSALLEVGDMYSRGCYPFYGTDPGTALEIYQVASRCPDRVVAARALSSFVNTRTNPVSHRDSVGQPFPSEIATRLLGVAEHQVKTTPFHEFNKRLRAKSLNPRPPRPKPENVAVAAAVPQAPVVAQLVLDKQNVHDHAISQTTKKNVKHLVAAERDGDFDRVELIDSVMSVLKATKQLSETKLSDAFRVVASLVPDKIESMGCSQLDVLNATFSKIGGVEDKCLRANLHETLGNNLASGVERDRVVCSTGKIARIVSTLEGTDLVKNKCVPIEVIRREIGTLASKVRDDVLSEATDENRLTYNSCTTVHALSATMKKRFEAQVNATYVDGLGLSPKVLESWMNLYSSEF